MNMHLHNNYLTVNESGKQERKKRTRNTLYIYMICLSCISAKWVIYLSNFLKFQLFVKINGELRNRL